MKHILFVNDLPFNPSLGGIERVTDTITRGLLTKGYKISYLCDKVDNNELLDYNFPVTVYQFPKSGTFANKENETYYNTLLKEQKIDIVINQRGFNSYMNPLLSNDSVKRISVVHTTPAAFTNLEIWLLRQRLPGFVGKLKYLFRRIFFIPLRYFAAKKQNAITSLQMEYIVQHSEAVVMLCDNYVKELRDLGVKPKNNEARLLAISNPNTFSEISDIPEKQKEILFVGRAQVFEKNILALIKIWRRIYAKFPDWKLVIVGDGPALPIIRQIIEKKKIQRVVLEGHQSDVSHYYQRASVVCLTSIYEGWGMALTEGMQHGCVPFAFNTSGAIEEIIDHKKCGMVIRPDNIKEYAARLSEVMRNDELRKSMSQAAKAKCELWSGDKIIEQWVDLLESL